MGTFVSKGGGGISSGISYNGACTYIQINVALHFTSDRKLLKSAYNIVLFKIYIFYQY